MLSLQNVHLWALNGTKFKECTLVSTHTGLCIVLVARWAFLPFPPPSRSAMPKIKVALESQLSRIRVAEYLRGLHRAGRSTWWTERDIVQGMCALPTEVCLPH